mgnify:CR=1 FL=1
MARNRYVYGPVPSRRLGRSLGVDLVPQKTCTYDCVYCQLGRTARRTLIRREYAPVDEILREVAGKLSAGPAPDYDYLLLENRFRCINSLGQLHLQEYCKVQAQYLKILPMHWLRPLPCLE